MLMKNKLSVAPLADELEGNELNISLLISSFMGNEGVNFCKLGRYILHLRCKQVQSYQDPHVQLTL